MKVVYFCTVTQTGIGSYFGSNHRKRRAMTNLVSTPEGSGDRHIQGGSFCHQLPPRRSSQERVCGLQLSVTPNRYGVYWFAAEITEMQGNRRHKSTRKGLGQYNLGGSFRLYSLNPAEVAASETTGFFCNCYSNRWHGVQAGYFGSNHRKCSATSGVSQHVEGRISTPWRILRSIHQIPSPTICTAPTGTV
jgi:hypothetical protein